MFFSRGCAHDSGCNICGGKLLVILCRSRFGAYASRFCLLARLRLSRPAKVRLRSRVALSSLRMTHRGYVVRTYEKNAACGRLPLIRLVSLATFPPRGRLPNSPPQTKQLSERIGLVVPSRSREQKRDAWSAPKSDSIANKSNEQNKMGEHELSQYCCLKNFLLGSF